MDLTESFLRVFPDDVLARYDMRETRNAAAVLENTNPDECADLIEVLRGFTLQRNDIDARRGGRLSPACCRDHPSLHEAEGPPRGLSSALTLRGFQPTARAGSFRTPYIAFEKRPGS
jgi:hypothetical protein